MRLSDGMRACRQALLSPRLLDGLFAGIIAAGMIGLFLVDVSMPRGILDGLGYPAIVALAARFGRRIVLACACLVTILIVLAAPLVPDAGISVAGEFANRFFGLLAVWIVALVLRQRLGLEGYISAHETGLARHQLGMLQAVREVLLAEKSFAERIQRLCEISAFSLQCGRVGVFRWQGLDRTMVCLNMYRHPENRHGTVPDLPENMHPEFQRAMHRDYVVVANDVQKAEFLTGRIDVFAKNDVRAAIGAGIVLNGVVIGQITFCNVHEPRNWTTQEIIYARALANLAAMLFAAERNNESLAALNMVREGICVTNHAGEVLYANRAARRMALAKAGITEMNPPANAYPQPEAPLEGEEDRHEIAFGGRELEIQRARLPNGGVITRINDITESNAAVRESAELQARLQQAAKMEAVGQLASGVAHDFNNILGAIAGFAGFIAQDSQADSENRDFAQRILSASRRGKEMVEQIMAFAETRSVSHGVVNLGRVVKTSQELLASGMYPGALLETEVPPAPLLVRGNEVQIGQLIVNLATNGRDALDGRPGLVEVEAALASEEELARLVAFSGRPSERLLGQVREKARYARLTVRDSGGGIAPQIMDRVFEPFFSTKGRQRGTGLGLAVVHGVVRAHDGLCHLISEAGQGTSFSIYLPLVEDALEAQAPVGSFSPCRVLIVDDEADMADMLAIGLERLGFQTVATQNPLTALAALEEDPEAFDALLTDQSMPGMLGTELIREARRVAPDLRTVLCTGNPDKLDDGKAGLADAVLYKPAEIQAIAMAVGPLRTKTA